MIRAWKTCPRGLRAGLETRDFAGVAQAYALFCRDVIDVVAPLVSVVKPQAAFFEQLGPAGMSALADVMAYASGEGLLVVVDGKRNDIGTTATAYAEAYLGPIPRSAWGGDALTVSPYLGADSLEPFLELASERGAGIFVLVKTSNPGGGLFQDLKFEDGQTLYQRVGGFRAVGRGAHLRYVRIRCGGGGGRRDVPRAIGGVEAGHVQHLVPGAGIRCPGSWSA